MRTDRAALLERLGAMLERGCTSDECCAHASRDRLDDADKADLTAWAAELEAEPPWLDAPDGPGDDWLGGLPGTEPRVHDVEPLRGALGASETAELSLYPLYHPRFAGFRWRRSTPVVVPPREAP